MENENLNNEVLQPGSENTSGKNESLNNDRSVWEKFREDRKLYNAARVLLIIIGSLIAALSLFLFIVFLVPALQEIPSGHKTEIASHEEVLKDAAYKKAMTQMSKDLQRLQRKYLTYSPGQTYIVINTTENKFYLFKNKKLVREGSCSTGSYKKLVTAEGKSWIFKTPRGKFEIHGKRTNPVWHKPDWAFVEEGVPIPPASSPLRWEAGVLGDYALDLEDSYMIHGTIYKRFLGMPVTHGCVRLNDEDLEVVFNTLNIGSKVFIY
jgi:hypothetical protein